MKKYIILLTIVITLSASAEDLSIGRIVNKTGRLKKSNISCNSDNCISDAFFVYPGDRIITSSKSEAEIILNDGTALKIYEKSDVIIFNIINTDDKTLTTAYSDYGKFKIIQKNNFLNASLLFKTRTAVIKSVCASMSIISGKNETGIFVYNGEAGFANIDPSIENAYIIKSGYESFLNKETPPTPPEKVEYTLRKSWIDRHFLTADTDKIQTYDKKSGALNWFFLEKN